MRLLNDVYVEHDRIHVMCGDLTLPKPSGDDVLPITIVMHAKIEKGENLHEYRLGTYPYYGDCSDAGYLRGFYRKHYKVYPRDQPRICPIIKFTIDFTQDECSLAIGEILPPEWNNIKDPAYGMFINSFDASGRLCLVKTKETDDAETFVVVDIE
ncbi:hypothetical protein OG21DRAFT_1486246 [Imleria badia]|nr:hypothetical protein OG21DRAFT_1486246 [Imleria badia]